MARHKKYRSVERTILHYPGSAVSVEGPDIETPLTWEGGFIPPGPRTLTMEWWRKLNARYLRERSENGTFFVVVPGVAFASSTDESTTFSRLEEDPDA